MNFLSTKIYTAELPGTPWGTGGQAFTCVAIVLPRVSWLSLPPILVDPTSLFPWVERERRRQGSAADHASGARARAVLLLPRFTHGPFVTHAVHTAAQLLAASFNIVRQAGASVAILHPGSTLLASTAGPVYWGWTADLSQ